MTPQNLASLPDIAKVLDAIDRGIAIFDANKKLLYTNAAMRAITGGSNVAGWSLKDLIQKHQLQTESGEIMSPDQFPINDAFEGRETRDKVYEYVSDTGKHTWLSVSCLRVLDDAGELEYVFTTISNISLRKARQDKLSFLLEATKTLSLTGDFRERLKQKARLTVPRLADWCAIDVLSAEGDIERIVLVHKDQKMLDYIRTYQERYPADPQSPTNPEYVIRTGKSHFTPRVTPEMLDAAASSPEQAAAIRKLNLKSVMAIPILSSGKALGCMTLAYAESGRMYNDEDFDFFKEFCDHLGILLENARLYGEITRRDKAKDIFLASLSHELRNPLAPIKTALELMRLQGVPESLDAEVATIEHQFDHMTRLLSDLLDVTRYTQAKISLTRSVIDITPILTRVVRAAEPLARNASIRIAHSFPADPVLADVDATRIEQAVMNLVSNAIKFTNADGTISLSLTESNGMALISVRDDGGGIEQAHLPNIFEMYYQGDRAKHRVSSGLGIGLYLVRKISELHGGSVEAESAGMGHGSTFTIRIPLHADEPVLSSSNASAAPLEMPTNTA